LRVVTGTRGTRVYIANPAILDKSESYEMAGVGFPLENVFRFDKPLFSALELNGKNVGRPPIVCGKGYPGI
jgi:hypothetical protein